MKPLLRFLLYVGMGLCLAACTGLQGPGGSRTIVIPTERLQRAVGAHFPFQQGITGWLDLKVLAPRLTLLPDTNRIAADVDVSLAGRLLSRSYGATVNLEFGLRFEPADNSIRITQLQVTQLQLSDVPEHFRAAVRQQAPLAAEQSLSSDMKLYQFSDDDIRKAREAGYRPGDVRITRDGLSLSLVPIN